MFVFLISFKVTQTKNTFTNFDVNYKGDFFMYIDGLVAKPKEICNLFLFKFCF